jgi:ABC-type branched-subunit amino acid transport system substrate-binding protein
MALLALALERAAQVAGGEPTGEQVRAALAEVSSPPGETVRWDELDRALALVRAGADVDYVGASGGVDFDANGDVALSRVEFWTVHASAIKRMSVEQ